MTQFDKVHINGQRYSYTVIDQRASMTHWEDGGRYLRTLHPYDMTEYHWAHSLDGRHWRLMRDRAHKGDICGGAKKVVAELRRLDAPLTARIDHS